MGLIADTRESSKAIAYVDLARPYNAVAALLPFLIGYYFFSPKFAWFNLCIGLCIVLLLHSAATMHNDAYDQDVDTANKRTTPLTAGTVTAGGLRQMAVNLVLASLVIAWFSTYKYYCLVFIAAYAAAAWAYNSPPIRGGRRPLVSIALLGLCYGLLPLGFGFFISGNHPSAAFWSLAAMLTVAKMSVSILKDFKDAKGDRKHHKRTFYLVFGKQAVIQASCALALVCYPIMAVLVVSGVPLPLLVILVLVAATNVTNRLMLLKAADEGQLALLFRKSFVWQCYFEIVVVVCLILS